MRRGVRGVMTSPPLRKPHVRNWWLEESNELNRFGPSTEGLAIEWQVLLDHVPAADPASDAQQILRMWISSALHHAQLRSRVVDTLRAAVRSTGPAGSQQRRDLGILGDVLGAPASQPWACAGSRRRKQFSPD